MRKEFYNFFVNLFGPVEATLLLIFFCDKTQLFGKIGIVILLRDESIDPAIDGNIVGLAD